MEVVHDYTDPPYTLLDPTDKSNTSANETMKIEEDFWELRAANFLYAYPSIILFIIGAVGNSLSFIVFSRSNMKHSVTSVYFRVLAISDTVVLFSGCFLFFIIGAFGIDMQTLSTVSCKFWLPCLFVSCYHSCWILVFIAVDRFVGVYVPHKYRKYCSQKQAVICMVVLFIVISATVGVFWWMALELNQDETACVIAAKYFDFFNDVFLWLDLCLLNLIPTIILVTLNIAIIMKITKAALNRQSTMGGASSSSKNKVSSPTAILLSVSLVYILCTIPSSTKFLVGRAFPRTPHGNAQHLLYTRSCETLYLFNHSVNFFLYCVHGTSFRKELRKVFRIGETRTTSSRTDSTAMSSSVRKPKYTKREDVW